MRIFKYQIGFESVLFEKFLCFYYYFSLTLPSSHPNTLWKSWYDSLAVINTVRGEKAKNTGQDIMVGATQSKERHQNLRSFNRDRRWILSDKQRWRNVLRRFSQWTKMSSFTSNECELITKSFAKILKFMVYGNKQKYEKRINSMWGREKLDSDVGPYSKWGHMPFSFPI